MPSSAIAYKVTEDSKSIKHGEHFNMEGCRYRAVYRWRPVGVCVVLEYDDHDWRREAFDGWNECEAMETPRGLERINDYLNTEFSAN
jgi:hypothetical protein